MTNLDFYKENPDKFLENVLANSENIADFIESLDCDMDTERKNSDRTVIINVGFVYNIPDNISSVDDIYIPMVTTKLASALHKTIIPFFNDPQESLLKPDDITFGATQYFEFGDDSE